MDSGAAPRRGSDSPTLVVGLMRVLVLGASALGSLPSTPRAAPTSCFQPPAASLCRTTLGQGSEPCRVHLHHGRQRQLLHHNEGVRRLVVGQHPAAVCAQHVQLRRRAGSRDDHHAGHTDLAEHIVGHTAGPRPASPTRESPALLRPQRGRRCTRHGCSARVPGPRAAGSPPGVRLPKSPVVTQPSGASTVSCGASIDEVALRCGPRVGAPAPVATHGGCGTQEDAAH